MALALRLAKKSDPYPNPRVGAVLVKDGRIIGQGYHKAPGKPHAEIEAIEDAKRKNGPRAAQGASLYVTLEPCTHTMKRTPPCTDAIIRERISEVIFAMEDPNPLVKGSGAKALLEAGISVEGPVAIAAAKAINKRYTANISKKPLVIIKMAMSADGKTATRTGDSRWISCPESRALVHMMRSRFDAVMVGANTVNKDDPDLTSHGKGRDPYRIIVDGKLSMASSARVVRNPDRKTIIATTSRASKTKIRKLVRNGAGIFICGESYVDIGKLVLGLSAMGMKKIIIEGGSELNAAALKAGVVDRLYLFIAPKIIGGRDARPVIGGIGIERMDGAIKLENMKMKKVGGDFLLEAEVKT